MTESKAGAPSKALSRVTKASAFNLQALVASSMLYCAPMTHCALGDFVFVQELQELQKTKLAFASVAPHGDNLLLWHAKVDGPKESPYEGAQHKAGCCFVSPAHWMDAGGVFTLEIKFPNEYPIKAPEVRFVTTILHPNVSMKANGQICQGACFGLELLGSAHSLRVGFRPADQGLVSCAAMFAPYATVVIGCSCA